MTNIMRYHILYVIVTYRNSAKLTSLFHFSVSRLIHPALTKNTVFATALHDIPEVRLLNNKGIKGKFNEDIETAEKLAELFAFAN